MMKEKYEAGLVALPLPEDVHSLAVAGTRAKVRGRKQRESQRRAATSAHKEYWSDLSNKQPSPRKRKHTEGQTCPICGVLFTPIKYSKPSTTGRVLVSHRNRGETCSEQCKLELAARTNRSVGEDGKLYFTSESARTYGDRRRRRATSL